MAATASSLERGAQPRTVRALSPETWRTTQIAHALREHLGQGAHRVPTRRLPDVLARIGALAVPAMREMKANLGVVRHVDNTRARSVLDWQPRTSEQAVTASGQSLIDLGLLRAGRS